MISGIFGALATVLGIAVAWPYLPLRRRPLAGPLLSLLVVAWLLWTGEGRLAAASLLWMAVGLLDDMRGLSPATKLAGQLLTGLVLVGWPRSATEALLLLGVIVWMNAWNFIDGLDGLAAVLAVVSLLLLPQPPGFLMGVLLGFLFWNWPPARAFLGDTASHLLGLWLLWLPLTQGIPLPRVALWSAVPLLDFLWAVLRRTPQLRWWRRDQAHLHHLLARRLGTLRTLFLLGILQLLLSAVGRFFLK